jgi:excisionase family DNA binding protein
MPSRPELSLHHVRQLPLDFATAPATKTADGEPGGAGRHKGTASWHALDGEQRSKPTTEPEPNRRRSADPYVVSVPEAAELLGISKDLAYDLARRGDLPGAIQLGRRWRVSLVRLRQALHGSQDGVVQETSELTVAGLQDVGVDAQRRSRVGVAKPTSYGAHIGS